MLNYLMITYIRVLVLLSFLLLQITFILHNAVDVAIKMFTSLSESAVSHKKILLILLLKLSDSESILFI